MVLDVGEIVNYSDSIVSTAGSSGGTLELHCFNQVKGNIGETLELVNLSGGWPLRFQVMIIRGFQIRSYLDFTG